MKLENITLAGGCFWCLEAVYQNIRGIQKVTSGYANGDVLNPTYKSVCSGTTGYAEAVKVEFDTETISLEQILEVFWHIHDPTTPNRQGADIGTQYRSGVYYSDEAQKVVAEATKQKAQEMFAEPIVTEIEALENWYEAEEYHQNYFVKNPYQGYCMAVVAPKVMKFQEKFENLLV